MTIEIPGAWYTTEYVDVTDDDADGVCMALPTE